MIIDFVSLRLELQWSSRANGRNHEQSSAIASALAFSLTLIGAAYWSAYAGPDVARGHCGLSYDSGGSDCSFSSYSASLWLHALRRQAAASLFILDFRPPRSA
jgi:hypothetical protein